MTFYEPDLSVKSLKDNGGEIYKEEKTIAVEDGISAIGMNDVYKAKDLGDLKFKRWYCPFLIIWRMKSYTIVHVSFILNMTKIFWF